MVDSRNSAPRRAPPRSAARIARLVLMLVVVLWLMARAGQPGAWEWLWQFTGGARATAASQAGEENGAVIDTRRPLRPADEPQREVFIARREQATPDAATDATPAGYFPGVQPKLLAKVRDDAVVRAEEHDALLHLCRVAQQASPAALEAAAARDVGFAQLYRQPTTYRGRLVRVDGAVRRVGRVRAPQNDWGLGQLHELWLQPADAPTQPMAFYCLELPPGFPREGEINETVHVSGFFFKRWLYNAHDTLRTTPLLIAHSPAWNPPAAAQATPARWTEMALVLLIGAVAGLLGAAVLFRASGSRRAARQQAPLLFLALSFVVSSTTKAQDAPTPTSSQLADGPQEFFRLLGIDEVAWDQVARLEASALDASATLEILLPLLNAVRRSLPRDVMRWAATSLDAREHDRLRPGDWRRFTGRVVECRRISLPAPQAERFPFREFYRCRCESDDGEQVELLTLHVPRAWGDAAPATENRVACDVCVLGHLTNNSTQTPLVAGRRLEWRRDTQLGSLGMDEGLFDLVEQRKRLTSAEADAFYSLLAAVERSAAGELRAAAGDRSASVVPLFNEPQEQVGRLVRLDGTARRAVRIEVEDAALSERFGLDHYYEVELFTADSQGSPLVACLRHLPPEMPLGEQILERVSLAGFFYKVWAYEITTPTDEPDTTGQRIQLAPLVIGRELVWQPQPTIQPQAAGWIAVALFGVAVALGGAWLWRQARADRAAARQRAAMIPTAPREAWQDLAKQVTGPEQFLGDLAQHHEPPPSDS